MLNTLVLLTLLAAATSFFLTPVTIKLAKKFGLLDDPKKRPHPAHTHKGIIPRAGGLPIFLGIFSPLLFLFPLTKQLSGVLIGATILILVGLWDDRKDRSPYIRLLTNTLSAIIVVGSGVGIPYITNPFGGVLHLDKIGFLADIIAFGWILWATNIIGWSGGVDGQLPGFVAISAIVIGVLSLRFVNTDPSGLSVTYLSFLTAGAYLGFLPWNFYPQKIMPGYGGKTLAGFMLAILSILSFSKLGTALLVLAVPITDASFMLVRRIIQRRSPVRPSLGHLHHHLLLLGWSRRKVAFFYWLISAIAGVAALTLTSQQKVFIAVVILVIISGFILWLNLLSKLPSATIEEEY